MSKIALITGVTGQDGAYLSEFTLKTPPTNNPKKQYPFNNAKFTNRLTKF
jgi:hypothetical protein